MRTGLGLAALSLALGCWSEGAPETAPAPTPEPATAETTTAAYFARLERAFTAQPPDGAWGPRAEGQLRQAAPLGIVACRTTLCRVELTLADPEAQESFAAAASALFPEAALDTRGRRTVAFLAREGTALPAGDTGDREGQDGERATAEH